MSYRLLDAFRATFEGQAYLHRRSNLGDRIAAELYEDLFELRRSTSFADRVEQQSLVLNRANTRRGVPARRGDGTLGYVVPGVHVLEEPGFSVRRAPVATVEIGAEVKILMKAMMKQIDRVIGDLNKQVEHFRRGGGNPIAVAIVGVNQAAHCTTYERDRTYPTDGREYPHPVTEAPAAERRLIEQARPQFDEFIILRFRATNVPPFSFEWVDLQETELDYGASLTRISRLFEARR